MSASDPLTAVQLLYGAVNKVKDNREELLSISGRIEHIILALEDSKQRDVIQVDEYNDALTAISNLILWTQSITQRLLKRSIGDRTWNAAEISGQIKKLNQDVQNYLSVHTIRALDIMQASHNKQFHTLSNNVEEIMVKIAELDIQLRTPPGHVWASDIQTQARDNISNTPARAVNFRRMGNPEDRTGETHLSRTTESVSLHALAASAKTSVTISGLKLHPDGAPLKEVTISGLNINAGYQEILKAVKDAGYSTPDAIHEQHNMLSIVVAESESVYDATALGGLQIAKSEPLLWWWNKYTDYHGMASATTPGQTVAEIGSDGRSVEACGVTFRFHRTLRVPDTDDNYDLPPDMGCFPLIPVARNANRLPENVRERGGFLVPMFRREALWISFQETWGERAAVKISVGGVNAISGADKDSMTPPNVAQDYIVAGLQPWLDGIATSPGVVRQFVATVLGEGYTVEEQVTGKAEHGGIQLDVFPRRNFQFQENPFYQTTQWGNPSHLNHCMTPVELGLGVGKTIHFKRPEAHKALQDEWNLSKYRLTTSSSANLFASYYGGFSFNAMGFRPDPPPSGHLESSILGVSAGGSINQKVYRDPDSPRVYDEEHGHRFHVHIISPELWETLTGVLPPVTPITPEMYLQHNIPWFTMYDNYVPSLTTASDALGKVKSVARLDDENEALMPTSSNLIDPDRPPRCVRHPRAVSSCVFRPCGHSACETCIGLALLGGSKCHECRAGVTKFVGIKHPLPQVSEAEGPEGSNGLFEWNIREMEDLALAAADSKQVTVLHLPGDSVSPLYSNPFRETQLSPR